MFEIALLTAAMALAQSPKPDDLQKAPPEDPPVDKAALNLLTDGKKHFLAFPKAESWRGPHYWSEDGKTFFRLRSPGGGADGNKSFDVTLWEPRIAGNAQTASFSLRDGKYKVACGNTGTDLTLVADADAKPVLDAAQFFKPRWRRMPYALARDDKGSYYFVDHLREDEQSVRGKRDFRLFTGPRGALKQQQMTNLVSDSEGDIFGTKSGEFRLVLNREANSAERSRSGKWVSGGKETKLTWVPIEDNVQVIYNELGVYDRARLGTPCDDL